MEEAKTGRFIGKKVAGVALAAALSASLLPGAAFAVVGTYPTTDKGIVNENGVKYLTGAACRAAMPVTDILGISGVEETGNFLDMSDPLNVTRSHASAKYAIMGTDFNPVANPYIWNYNYNTYAQPSVASSDTIVYNSARNGGGQGPNAALATVTEGATSTSGLDATDLAVWEKQPDIIIGTGANAATTAAAYARTAALIDSDYDPAVVTYAFTTNNSMIDVMYQVATDADDIVEAGAATVDDSTDDRALRYGAASDIAVKYERFIKGTQGLVLSAIADPDNSATRQTVAVISEDNGDGTYKVLTSGIEDGTASTNRALEALEVVADVVEAEDYDAVTLEELEECDAIIVSSQGAGVSDTDELEGIAPVYTTTSSAGSMYGTSMNSVENAQNISRVIGFVYPDVVDPVNFTAYYFETFYHVNNGSLGTLMSGTMDDYVSLPDGFTTWAPASYSANTVEGLIGDGCDYILTHSGSVNSVLYPNAGVANGFVNPYTV